ncbi:hypothetical protein [Reyranella sp. CPCC 100927]|uniref:hypothetical protein n=1 Tax=Reyranella sp. CPCC 100927 TaxID=2599616 RepID=UPI0011B7866C|nr:hypothetical protein [Reyranella sp. CPCC 100927]TWT15727.1 hypothetical protein FQU96_05130 [Reyranella sp. CPCC 100927]
MALVQYKNDAVESSPSARRAELLARYRQLRDISKQLHHDIIRFMSGDTVLDRARRLGLARGKTLLLEEIDEMNYVYDLAIHTAVPGRSRTIDRYARSTSLAAGSDEALVLEAMRTARFSILSIEQPHEVAGLIATDLVRKTTVWLVDVGLERSLPAGSALITRLYTLGEFAMTAGVSVPLDPAMLLNVRAALPYRLAETPLTELIDSPRFAETVYRAALHDGVMDRVRYEDVSRDP